MVGGNRGSSHPSAANLERFLRGELTAREATPVVAHLLTGCPSCRQQMAPLASVLLAPHLEPAAAPATNGAEYDFPLFRAFSKARRYAAAVEAETVEAQREHPLVAVSPLGPLTLEQRTTRDQDRCEAFLDRCLTLRHSDPEAALMLASLAASLAERIAAERGTAETADLQARAWAEVGNARRVTGDLAAAEIHLSRALGSAEQGTGDKNLLVQLMDLTASLFVDQQRFAEAMQLLDGVERMQRAAGDLHAAGRALVSKGTAAGYAQRFEEAVHLLGEALPLLDAHRDSKLVFMTVHNLLLYLVEVGRSSEAARLFAESRALYALHQGRLERLNARWLEGRIAAAQADDAAAEAAFSEVRTGFAEGELPYDAALATLELAEICLRQGRTREIKGLIDEMVAIFKACNIRREAIAALLMLREACEQERATVALLRTVTSELQRLERDPVRHPRSAGSGGR
jgi:tetratricopeptide (TPR) repeat protein